MQAQTPLQLRELTALDLTHPPSLRMLAPPGCARTGSTLCRLADFESLMRRRLAAGPQAQ